MSIETNAITVHNWLTFNTKLKETAGPETSKICTRTDGDSSLKQDIDITSEAFNVQ